MYLDRSCCLTKNEKTFMLWVLLLIRITSGVSFSTNGSSDLMHLTATWVFSYNNNSQRFSQSGGRTKAQDFPCDWVNVVTWNSCVSRWWVVSGEKLMSNVNVFKKWHGNHSPACYCVHVVAGLHPPNVWVWVLTGQKLNTSQWLSSYGRRI